MRHWITFVAGAAMLAFAAPKLLGQAEVTVTHPIKIQTGVSFLILHNDYGSTYNKGLTVYGDYHLDRFLGIEAKAQFGGIITPQDIGENFYALGPKIFYPYRKYILYGKFLSGVATISNQNFGTLQRYSVFSFGGGLEIRVTKRLNLRPIDFEVQKWNSFNPHTLTPIATTFGLAYVIK